MKLPKCCSDFVVWRHPARSKQKTRIVFWPTLWPTNRKTGAETTEKSVSTGDGILRQIRLTSLKQCGRRPYPIFRNIQQFFDQFFHPFYNSKWAFHIFCVVFISADFVQHPSQMAFQDSWSIQSDTAVRMAGTKVLPSSQKRWSIPFCRNSLRIIPWQQFSQHRLFQYWGHRRR